MIELVVVELLMLFDVVIHYLHCPRIEVLLDILFQEISYWEEAILSC